MTYNSNFSSSNGGLGMPGAGFASRGKGNGLKRLSLASPPKVGPISENPSDSVPTPRTSRSYLLAGLRTAPKTPAAASSAPYHQTQHNINVGQSKYAPQHNVSRGNVPHTAIGSSFPGGISSQQFILNPGQQFYTLPEQVLAPPPVEIDEADEQMDPNVLAQLYATEIYLMQRQQQLQQQLANLTAQQLGGLNLNNLNNNNNNKQSSFPQTPVSPQNSLYNQQLQNGVSPIPQEVPGQPGLYLVFNPLTGQYTYAVDPNMQGSELANSPPPPTPSNIATNFHGDVRKDSGSPFYESSNSPFGSRSMSPPKATPSPPQDVTPLPPPSANAFRRNNHRKGSSLVLNNTGNVNVTDGPKSAMIRPVGMPPTPMTGTFGLGQARAGEHPTRQPRGPPPFEELSAKPTTKHEGSKNFATRQRRRALNSLVRAGLERRVARPGSGSAGSMTPVSDTELTFSVPSDNDSDSGHSGKGSVSLSGKPSIGSLRAVANGAIGSERKEMSKRSRENMNEAMEKSDAETAVELKQFGGERRQSPLLVLSNAAEKRTSTPVAA